MSSLENALLTDWYPKGRPLYVFGPCSAESREQLFETARGIAQGPDPFILRAGVWKPRTRPGNFEGRGEEALAWMAEVKAELNIPITTEVANADHVEACLKHGVDVLWIGARTTVNPFSVQEIADALKGVDIPVMVKNPIHPDLSLWIGAMERLSAVGIKKLVAIHRGFHYHENFPYRNQPNWELAIELRRRFRDLPIICDASHISGRPELIPRVAQRAMDLHMDGLLIESHIDPKVALSDAKQQITPSELLKLIASLEIREATVTDPVFHSELEQLRRKIDHIDESLTALLAERMNIVAAIGEQKKDQHVTIFQVDRWAKIIDNYLEWGNELGLRPEFIRRVLEAVHLESIEIQQQVMNDVELEGDSTKPID
jgi:chorismate mutase